jgi:hypothetical protein
LHGLSASNKIKQVIVTLLADNLLKFYKPENVERKKPDN